MKIGYILLTGLLLIGAGCTNSKPPATSDIEPFELAPTANYGAKLILSGRDLEQVPMSVFDRTELQELNVSNNRLSGSLPFQIQRLKNLRILNARNNQMTGVPAEIGQLSNLEELDLSDNKLTGLPMELGNLTQLRLLDLRNNDISKQDLDAIRANLKQTEILE